MRAELFGNLRKVKKEKTSSRADRRSISCRSPTRESRLVSIHKARARNVDDACIERFPLRSCDMKASVASDKSNRGSMIWIPGGSFLMGSNEFYREERPAHQETVQGLWIDPYPVTNAEFGKFVGATGYVTTCERPPDPAMYPDADPSLLVPGSSVFRKPRGPVDLRDNRVWWEAFAPEGRAMANTWQGRFPWENLKLDGYEGTSPVDAFPANGYGLYDMIGNVWEWTSSVFTPPRAENFKKSCCVPSEPGGHIARRVVKGGSHLCAPNYCLRYRPAARQGEAVDTSACHIGFRCVVHGSKAGVAQAV